MIPIPFYSHVSSHKSHLAIYWISQQAEGPYLSSCEQVAVGHEQETSAHGTGILAYSLKNSNMS